MNIIFIEKYITILEKHNINDDITMILLSNEIKLIIITLILICDMKLNDKSNNPFNDSFQEILRQSNLAITLLSEYRNRKDDYTYKSITKCLIVFLSDCILLLLLLLYR